MTGLYTECRCAPKALSDILRKAVEALAEHDPRYREVDRTAAQAREQTRREIQAKLAELSEFGATQTQLKDFEAKLVAGIKVPKEAEELDALRKYIDECECPPGVSIDWMHFPYHEIGYKAPSARQKTPAGTCSTEVPADQISEWTERVRKYNEKYVTFLTEDVFEDMNRKYGPAKWAQSELKRELRDRGVLEEWEYTDWYDLNNKIRNVCKDIKGERTDLMHGADSVIQRKRAQLAEKHGITLPKKEEFGFGKK